MMDFGAKGIQIEKYKFSIAETTGDIIIEYSDGQIISTAGLQAEMVGIIKNGTSWSVVVSTAASLHKYKTNATETLELFGLDFKEFSTALFINNVFASRLLGNGELEEDLND